MKKDSDKNACRGKGISIVVGYITNTAIILIAVVLSVTLTQGAVGNLTDRAAEDGIESVGRHLANEIESADTLIQSGSAYGKTDVRYRMELPDSEQGYSANITYNGADGGVITISSEKSTVEHSFDNDTPIEDAGQGIRLTDSNDPVVTYNTSSGKMVIR